MTMDWDGSDIELDSVNRLSESLASVLQGRMVSGAPLIRAWLCRIVPCAKGCGS